VQSIVTVTPGWGKVKAAAKYAGISERSLRGWLKSSLRHVRLPSGTILVSFAAIDDFLARFEVTQNQVDDIVNEVVNELT